MGWFRNYIYTTPGLDCFYKLQQEKIMFIVYNMIMKKSPLSSTLYHLPSSFLLYPFIPPPLFSTPLSLLLYPLLLYPSSFILYPSYPSFILNPFIPPPLSSTLSSTLHLSCVPPAIILQFSSLKYQRSTTSGCKDIGIKRS